MTTISVPPGCTGIELPNGTKVDANRQGQVKTDDPRVERQLKKSTLAKMGVVSTVTHSFNVDRDGDTICEECHFRGFAWHTVCPKCESKMIQDKRNEDD